MINLPPAIRIFVCTVPTDMRRSFDGLAAMVRHELGREPRTGHLFVFFNRRRDRVKLLYWDRTGYVIWYKRLEKGTFRPLPDRNGQVELESSELFLLLEGIELRSVRRRHQRM